MLADRAKPFLKNGLSRELAVEKAASQTKNVNDVIRYTIEATSKNEYSVAYSAVREALEGLGMTFVQDKFLNAWSTSRKLAYRGINATFKTAKGQLFEVQFHTPESYAAKQVTHPLYQEWRAASTTANRRKTLYHQMLSVWESVPTPPGAEVLQ